MNEEDTSVLGLATIRQNRGISLMQIAETTKISIRSLEAIERGDFKKLPGGIYNTSYIRQYARAIDYDESALLSYYHQSMGLPATAEGEKSDRSYPGSGYRPASILGS
ncbi:MAG: helix-turn-helix domain-containing protein [Acidobacteriia bacterium]|nr:helix-turn-helix domain-containing protein [Terriglobia bacterium]